MSATRRITRSSGSLLHGTLGSTPRSPARMKPSWRCRWRAVHWTVFPAPSGTPLRSMRRVPIRRNRATGSSLPGLLSYTLIPLSANLPCDMVAGSRPPAGDDLVRYLGTFHESCRSPHRFGGCDDRAVHGQEVHERVLDIPPAAGSPDPRGILPCVLQTPAAPVFHRSPDPERGYRVRSVQRQGYNRHRSGSHGPRRDCQRCQSPVTDHDRTPFLPPAPVRC